MDVHKQICKMTDDYKEYWNVSNKERIDCIYNYLIKAHNKKYINVFEYNDDMFYSLFVNLTE